MTLTAAMALSPASAAHAQQRPVIGDFLHAIGGETLPSRHEKHWEAGGAATWAVRNTPQELVGHRFFFEQIDRGRPAPLVTTERALVAFAGECTAKGGSLVTDRDPALSRFYKEKVERLRPDNVGAYSSRAVVQLCATRQDDILAGFASIVSAFSFERGYDTAWRIRTLVHVFRGDAITPTPKPAPPSPAEIAARREAQKVREAQGAAASRKLQAFQAGAKIGTDTNCGTVIQVRGPVVEIALPPGKATENGQQTFWTKREGVFPSGSGSCAASR